MNYDDLIIPEGSFWWKEYAYLPRWKAYAVPTPAQKINATILFRQIEKLIREPIGKPLIISSGARTTEYTLYLRRSGVQAALHSAHIDWSAVDLLPPKGMCNADFWHWCAERWPGRMENLPFTKSWVHLDTRNWGDRQRFDP